MQHENETRICQNCKKDFTIESDDFSFYEKIKVPPPTWCGECRFVRRLAFQNLWNIYWRNCNKCGDKTLSMISPDHRYVVYCPSCWWKDDWDGTENAMEYDPSRSFLEQFKELREKTPYNALSSLYTSLKNSDYSNGLAWCKDCYLIFWADYCDGVYYSSMLNGLKYSADCLRGKNSELCYESIDINKDYQTFFSEECDSCVNVWFSRNLYNCTNCIGCANMRGVSNCIFNIKYSKEDYEQKVKELRLDSWQKLQDVEKQSYEVWLENPYRSYTGNSLNLNVTGDYVYGSRNCKNVYMCDDIENCRWTQFVTVPTAKDCMDYSGWGNSASRIYESVAVGEKADSVYFSSECWPDCLNVEYGSWNIAGKNNFGCANLKRKSYFILNKEYSKEEYERLKAKIIEDMKVNPYIDKLGREFYYGEFFPPELSSFPYNKSNAMRFFPKTKNEALSMGYEWDDTIDKIYEATMKAEALPDTLQETKEDILREIIECMNCGKGYRIVKGELDLLCKMNLPPPHECPKCRENKRFARLKPPKIYKRTCMKCEKEINTSFAPDRPEIVYCVGCYQGEFL